MEEFIGEIAIISLVLALGRTLLVLDGVVDFHGYGSIVYRISFCFRRITSFSGHEELEAGASTQVSHHGSSGESSREYRWI